MDVFTLYVKIQKVKLLAVIMSVGLLTVLSPNKNAAENYSSEAEFMR